MGTPVCTECVIVICAMRIAGGVVAGDTGDELTAVGNVKLTQLLLQAPPSFW
jgi:hypothetical protein